MRLATLFLCAIYWTIATAMATESDKTLEPRSSNGNFYFYACKNCKCKATYSYEDFSGQTPCLSLGFGSYVAAGLTAGTTCSLYFQSGCQGAHQSVGVHSGQTFGCTTADHNIVSVRCY